MRLYSEKEIGAILKRTAELSKSKDVPNADGLSLEELKQLALEAGLNPDLVVRAAAELSTTPSMNVKGDIFGGPLSHAAEFDLDVEIDQDMLERMLPTIRAHFKDPGIVQTRPGAFEWTGSGGELSKKAHVSFQNVNGGSKMHLFWSETTSAVPFYIPTIMSLVLAPAILFEEFALGLEGIPIWAAIVATFFLISRFGVASMKKRNVRRLDTLGKELTQIALQSSLSKRAERERTDHTLAPKDRSESTGLSTSSAPGGAEREQTPIELPDNEFEASRDSNRSNPDRERS